MSSKLDARETWPRTPVVLVDEFGRVFVLQSADPIQAIRIFDAQNLAGGQADASGCLTPQPIVPAHTQIAPLQLPVQAAEGRFVKWARPDTALTDGIGWSPRRPQGSYLYKARDALRTEPGRLQDRNCPILEYGRGASRPQAEASRARALPPKAPTAVSAGNGGAANPAPEAARDARAKDRLLAKTLDSLAAHIAILDCDGVIVTVNAAWRKFGRANGLKSPQAGVGQNYLDVCKRATGADSRRVSMALRKILAGERATFHMTYPCGQSDDDRWFHLTITGAGAGRDRRVVLSHEDVTDTKRATEAMHRLAGELLRTQDDERRRIARDLHDSTAQHLVAARLLLENSHHVSLPATDEMTTEAAGFIEQAIKEVRTLSYLLHPPTLDDLGLISSLRTLAQGFQERSGIDVAVRLPKAWRKAPLEVEIALFRVAQEALSNIQRHSGSPTAEISLRATAKAVTLTIKDKGAGFGNAQADHAARPRVGVGVSSMQARVNQLGGEFRIASNAAGSTVTARIPSSEWTAPAEPCARSDRLPTAL